MALTLNGSANTIAGLAVGGLPDGIVDAGTLASNSVETAKIATEAVTAVKQGPGSIVQYVQAVPADIHHRFSTTSDNPTYVDTDVHIDITPTNSTNRIIIGGYVIGVHDTAGIGSQYCIGPAGSAPTTGSTNEHNQMTGAYPGDTGYYIMPFYHHQIAGTTSEMTFHLWMRRSGNSGTVSIGWASSQDSDDQNSHHMWAMEVVV